jgi:hypothetical protein
MGMVRTGLLMARLDLGTLVLAGGWGKVRAGQVLASPHPLLETVTLGHRDLYNAL